MVAPKTNPPRTLDALIAFGMIRNLIRDTQHGQIRNTQNGAK